MSAATIRNVGSEHLPLTAKRGQLDFVQSLNRKHLEDRRGDDKLDPSVGFSNLAPLGAQVGPGQPLARVHAATEAAAQRAIAALQSAYALGDTPALPKLVQERIG